MGEIYHTDHLGSSTYLTDNFGRPSHYYETLPFGEMMVEHNQSTYNGGQYNNVYKFNGKELDAATGMYYYGARYYDPRISIFVSVDPLAEDFAGWTPYHYVHNSSVNMVDPTGMEAEGWGKKGNTWEYDEKITADNFESLGYDKYMESGNVYSTTNGVADGEYSYSLNKDGSVQNSYGKNKTESFTTPRGTNINISNDDSGLGMYKSLESTLDLFDFASSSAESFNTGNTFTKGLGTTTSLIGPYASYKVNSIEYQSGIIKRDRYMFRNTKIVASSTVGFVGGRLHPAVGYGGGKATSLLFDGIESSVDYLNNGFNQMKNQVIFTISNSR